MRRLSFWFSALLVSLAVVVGAAPAMAQIHPVQEYRVPSERPGLNRITTGPDGNLWFTEGAGRIGRMTPNGQFKEFATPSSLAGRDSNPIDITTGPDGKLWYTDFYGRIGRVNLKGDIKEFQIGSPQNQLFFFGITAGPDGALWFVVNCCGPNNGMIGRITTTGDVSFFPVAPGTGPAVGIISYHGQLWYTATSVPDPKDAYIQRMNTAGKVTGNFLIPTSYADPSRLAIGADGNLYFTEQGAVGANGHQEPTHPRPGKIGRIDPKGNITEFRIPEQAPPDFVANPAGIASGPDGNIWFTEYSYLADDTGEQHGGNKIGRLDIQTGRIDEFPLPTAFARADGITRGPNGFMYFVEDPNNYAYGQVGKIPVLP
ncbi:MAG TPA: hypothetical protein VHS52_00020 [Acidimicrobiales bacterium]|nr:hypothetical protein [Acidimicrobiales bacterium]